MHGDRAGGNPSLFPSPSLSLSLSLSLSMSLSPSLSPFLSVSLHGSCPGRQACHAQARASHSVNHERLRLRKSKWYMTRIVAEMARNSNFSGQVDFLKKL